MKISYSENAVTEVGMLIRPRKPSGAGLGFDTSKSENKLADLDCHRVDFSELQMRKLSESKIDTSAPKEIPVSSASPTISAVDYLRFYARLFIIMVISIFINSFGFLFYPFLTLLKPFYWRRFSDQLEAMWVNACLWLFPSTHLVQHGEFPDSSARPKVVICNHTTEVDWYYLWMVARLCKVDRTGSVKIMLKEGVARIPVIGWGCRLFQFIFLKRKWKEDEKIIENSLKRFCEDGEPLWIFLFPEGMTINSRSVEKSKAFARVSPRMRPELELTLLPRARGFQCVLELIEKYSSQSPEIFDMTMSFDSYTGEVPTWDMGYTRNRDVLIPNHSTVLLGKCSSRCHLDSRKVSTEEVFSHKHGVEGWLDDAWMRKERLLRSFIKKQGFDDEDCGPPKVTLVEGSPWKSFLLVAGSAAMYFYLAVAIQSKTQNVSFLEMLPQYI